MVVLKLDDLETGPLEAILRRVADGLETLRIELSDGQVVEVRPVTDGLKPLITFDSHVPEGWKDAIYGPR